MIREILPVHVESGGHLNEIRLGVKLGVLGLAKGEVFHFISGGAPVIKR